MPSVNNISELVFFGLIAAGLTVVILLGVKYSPASRRKDEEEENWDINNLSPLPPRASYADPVSTKVIPASLLVFGIGVTAAFIYYFITRGGFGPGN
ncbi:MAG: hypothetical protein HXX08_12495 [Chloroflexi bacterium]|uniref:Uncharacterized protein n=1 Tax=Candidatus Chlorohelix allophototropha TaxID=3003348 RepID=A0A8T7M305_9CHLR|nr:hypothetical protein [Chloroflexota bacterium]WJW66061.1 hypothetical protein OZ401_001844 [Chloroflexota bacterium L227-S17]